MFVTQLTSRTATVGDFDLVLKATASNSALALTATRHSLRPFFIRSPYVGKPLELNDHSAADGVEAIIGAVWADSENLIMVNSVLRKLGLLKMVEYRTDVSVEGVLNALFAKILIKYRAWVGIFN